MKYRLPGIALLRTFEAAARHLSFKKAAEELHVTPAAVSQQIKALEDWLGVPLFRRMTRALELTKQGTAMLPKVCEGFECFAAAIEATRERASVPLTVIAPPSFASHWLVPRLPHFSAAHPDIELRLASTADTIHRRGEAAVLEKDGGDSRDPRSEVAILYGQGDYPGYRVERVFTPDYVPVCVPSLPGLAALTAPHELGHFTLIHDETLHEQERGGRSRSGWGQWLRRAGVTGVDASRGPHFSNAVLAIDAALAGQGIALASKPLVEAHVAAGSLVIPFDLALPSPLSYFLVMRESISLRPAIEAFRTWLLAEAADTDETTD
ncbi:MAG: transcriptional regulator GcvA [Aromatoleum sp.]|jgi:LysR family glycine cleavage system transcriptional activator|uniref:transcriptional regulator GcvA n=1 Tax=Aromatoleum sp. TaxID=2307007 RepID=UPI002894CB92|nr:transcriptional regulator GcvA [Aromatoleum sp.]MDT3672473.1 transcriptional regulator GcvA [Aromatoleum sp.]